MNDVNSLSHTRWNCKYHIVFAPKYRRKVFYKQKREEVGKILRTLCEWKKVGIIEAEVCPDHVHMLVEIPPKISVSSFMGYLKGKSSLMIYEVYQEAQSSYFQPLCALFSQKQIPFKPFCPVSSTGSFLHMGRRVGQIR